MNRTQSPLVNTYCFYGLGVSTSLYYKFNGAPVLTQANYVGYGNGDGNQDYLDNEFCNTWANQLADNGYTFVATAFEGVCLTTVCYFIFRPLSNDTTSFKRNKVTHMEMVSNATVLNAILDVLKTVQ